MFQSYLGTLLLTTLRNEPFFRPLPPAQCYRLFLARSGLNFDCADTLLTCLAVLIDSYYVSCLCAHLKELWNGLGWKAP